MHLTYLIYHIRLCIIYSSISERVLNCGGKQIRSYRFFKFNLIKRDKIFPEQERFTNFLLLYICYCFILMTADGIEVRFENLLEKMTPI